MKYKLLFLFILFANFGFSQNKKGITSYSAPIKVVIYPNPVHNHFSLKTAEKLTKVTIINVVGKEVAVFYPQESYTVSQLKKGIYLLRLETKNGVAVQKLLIK